MRIIKVLTNKDAKHFNKEAPKYEVVIAGFFMVRCPACESFKPAWNNFVKSCQNKDDPRVLIAEVDSNQTSNENIEVKYPVLGKNSFKITFAGNIGRAQGLEELISIFSKCERAANSGTTPPNFSCFLI